MLHYSGQTARYRGIEPLNYPEDYRVFSSELTLRDIELTATTVLEEADMGAFIDDTLTRIRRSGLTDSKRKLIFTYKAKFEKLRRTGSIS